MDQKSDGGPLVSVIIPVFNAGHTVERCLTSVLASSYNRLEVLLVDDGSTDDTLDRASKYECRILRQPENHGAASSRNFGCREARGDILVFLDADVAIHPEGIGFMVEDLHERKLASAVIGVYTKTQEVEGLFSQYQNLFTYFNHEQSGTTIAWFWTALGAMRKDIFAETPGFNEKYRGASAEDMEMGYTLSRQGHRIAYDNRIKGVHLHHHGFGSLLRNNFRKSADLVALIWRMSRQNKFAHGFSNRRNAYAMTAAMFVTAAALLSFLDVRWSALFAASALALAASNLPFYRFVRAEKGRGFVFKCVLLHYFIYMTAGLGAAVGTGRYFLSAVHFRKPEV
jgi:glycosyltransferase involved in cell wall biosynthesis